LGIGKAFQDVLLTVGILSGQSDEEVIKATERYKINYSQSVEDSTCRRTYEERKEEEFQYKYSKAHERYWDSKHYKGYDKDYHNKNKDIGIDQDHDHKSDCSDYDDRRKKSDEEHAKNMEVARNAKIDWEAEQERIAEEGGRGILDSFIPTENHRVR
jgi:hypothetical protein